jgi:hypothetical protein
MISAFRAASGWPLVSVPGGAISHNTLFWLLQTAGWTAFGLMMFGYGLAREPVRPAIFDTLQLAVTGLALTSVYRYAYRWWRRRHVPPLALAFWIVLFTLAGVPLWYEPQAAITRAVHARHPSLVVWVPSYTEIPLETWLYWGFVLLSWSLLYFGINDWMSLQMERRRASSAEALAQGARLRVLQSQLQPHFLFNTLNSISSLILDGRSTAGVAMISRVSDFLRLSLQTTEVARIPLAKELTFLSHYLEIERLRFGDRLHYQVDAPQETLNALVPTLLLQPLVENAVRHGILSLTRGGSVAVTARTCGRDLTLRVEDDGPGFGGVTPPASGLGLANTATRLEELYGDGARVSVGRSTLGGVAIEISLPLDCDPQTSASSHAP